MIRGLPRWIKAEKKDVLKIGNIEDVDEKIKDPDERDRAWQHTKASQVINIIKKLENLSNRIKDQEDPLNRLSEALGKLNHEDLDQNQLEQMKIPDVKKAFKLCQEIENANNDLKSFFYELQKDTKNYKEKLKKKFNN